MSSYYSSLRGHESEFQNCWPILMYHKIGAPPRHTRIKGLYVPQELFQRQLGQWQAASGAWKVLGEPSPATGMTITFDDGFCSVLERGLETLRRTGCTAIQYLVPGLLGKTNEWDLPSGEVQEPLMDGQQIQEWLAAGQQIGAHTMTHPRLTQIPLEKAREEITASKKSLEDQFGLKISHFAYPYGDWNQRVRELVIEAGFTTACTTTPGVNQAEQDCFTLKRYMARSPSRRLFRPSTWLG